MLPTTEEHSTAEPTEDKEPRRLTPVYTYGSIIDYNAVVHFWDMHNNFFKVFAVAKW